MIVQKPYSVRYVVGPNSVNLVKVWESKITLGFLGITHTNAFCSVYLSSFYTEILYNSESLFF